MLSECSNLVHFSYQKWAGSGFIYERQLKVKSFEHLHYIYYLLTFPWNLWPSTRSKYNNYFCYKSKDTLSGILPTIHPPKPSSTSHNLSKYLNSRRSLPIGSSPSRPIQIAAYRLLPGLSSRPYSRKKWCKMFCTYWSQLFWVSNLRGLKSKI